MCVIRVLCAPVTLARRVMTSAGSMYSTSVRAMYLAPLDRNVCAHAYVCVRVHVRVCAYHSVCVPPHLVTSLPSCTSVPAVSPCGKTCVFVCVCDTCVCVCVCGCESFVSMCVCVCVTSAQPVRGRTPWASKTPAHACVRENVCACVCVCVCACVCESL